MLLALAADSASALAVVDTNVSAYGNSDKTSTSTITAQSSITFDGGSASASADLDLGLLKASAFGPGDPSQRLGTFASTATATFEDLVTFSPGASGTAYLEYKFDGTLNAPASNTGADAYLGITLNGQTLHQIYALDFPDDPGACTYSDPLTECTSGSSIDKVGMLPFQLGASSYDFNAFLQIIAENGATANFSDTAAFYLVLPPGVTYTSNSGVFLEGALPIVAAPVPEPATNLLLLAGIGLMVGVQRARRGAEQ